jgi:hypothetical protein
LFLFAKFFINFCFKKFAKIHVFRRCFPSRRGDAVVTKSAANLPVAKGIIKKTADFNDFVTPATTTTTTTTPKTVTIESYPAISNKSGTESSNLEAIPSTSTEIIITDLGHLGKYF